MMQFMKKLLLLLCFYIPLFTLSQDQSEGEETKYSKNSQYLLKSQIPINIDVDLTKALFGAVNGVVNYDIDIVQKISNDVVSHLGIDFSLSQEKTSQKYHSQLAHSFTENLYHYQLHGDQALDSRQEIEYIDTNEVGRWFINTVMGKKSVQVNAVDKNFSKSKTLKLTFNNLRNRKGKIQEKVTAFLSMKERFEEDTFDIYYQKSLDAPKTLLTDIQLNIKVSRFLKINFEISANNDTVQIF